MIKLIAAIGKNGLIGKDQKMPWHISQEFQHFKRTTMGHDLLFGQNTFVNLPQKLAGRKHIVLGFKKTPNADLSITSLLELNKLFKEYRNSKKILFIAGGKSIYEQFYQEADELIISEIAINVEGNVYLNLNLANWTKKLIKKTQQFKVYSYKKIKKQW